MSEHKLRFPDFKMRVKGRSMWKGSNLISESSYWMMNDETGKFEMAPANISDALLKCFDEILVNACDQYIRSVNTPPSEGGPVTQISVRFDEETGEITIMNNGQGFDIYKGHPDLPDPEMYTVEAVITKEGSGSNFGDLYEASAEDADRVTGGINGLGMKLIIVDSDKFSIETVDKVRNMYYYQQVTDSMEVIHPPRVIDISSRTGDAKTLTAAQKLPHTTISFIPDYANLCRKTQARKNPKWITVPENLSVFRRIIQFRTYQMAAFIGSTKYRYVTKKRLEYSRVAKVIFNGEVVPVKTVKDLADLMPVEGNTVMHVCKSEDNTVRFPWSIAVGAAAANANASRANSVHMLNSVHLTEGGSHINWLYGQILAHVNKKVKSVLRSDTVITDTRLRNFVFIVDSIQIPLPQFTSQSKTSMILGTRDLNKFKRTYVLPDAFLDKVWNVLRSEIELNILEREEKDSTSNKTRKNVKIRKYEKARKAGNSKFLNELMLFVPEGDSACKPIRDIITNKDTPLSVDFCGTYNIQGVPPNAIKESKDPVTRKGKPYIVKSKKLQANVAFNGLMAALNLNYGMQYKLDSEFKTLNYGCIVIATDQDLDGIGQICSLILVYFMHFFPELVKRGFVKRIATPLIRVYTNNKAGDVYRFYSEREYTQWVSDNYTIPENLPSAYEVSYYKGLAGHTAEEVIQDIGMNIEDNIYTFTMDDAAREVMNIAYGKSPALRKKFLCTPMEFEYDQKFLDELLIKCSEHFGIEAKSFQLDFMTRKLKHAVDGFIPSQRKAFAGGRKMANSSNKKVKVYQMTGKVTSDFHYQHGDTSMNDTIIKMAQNFTGGSNLPLFMPISNGFGDRRTGRDNTGSPRYIDTKYNKKLCDAMFPHEDDWLLDYVFEDGEQAEPVNYVPVLPIAIMENSITVAVGWNIHCWGRDPYEVIANVKRLIKFNYPDPGCGVSPRSLLGKVWIRPGMSVDICPISDSVKAATEVCFGSYTYNEKTEEVHITQLPLRMWSYDYKCMLEGIPTDGKKTASGAPSSSSSAPKEYVKFVHDDTGNDKTDITIKLVPGAYEKIMAEYGTSDGKIDPIEDYLGIRQQMHCRLNMITDDGFVCEFKNYEQIIEYWFPRRRDLYEKRIERQSLLLEFRIDYWENVLRFILADSDKTINIDKDFTAEQREDILTEHEFTKFNKSILFQPRYLKVDQLHEAIYSSGASYKYIDQITVGEKSQASVRALRAKIEDMKRELQASRATTWKSLWLREIDALEAVIREGIETNWLFGTKQHVFKKAGPRGKK